MADRRFVWGIRSLDDLILRDCEMVGGSDGSSSSVGEMERLYALGDAMSVTTVVDVGGEVLERYGYDGFGTPHYMTPAFGIRSASLYNWETLFDGYRYDQESGLYQVRYRYLHPSLGRWVSRDPIGEEGGVNFFSFAENNPIDFYDFDGLVTVKKHAWSITQEQAMSGIWGWTDLESQEENPAKLKMNKKLCLCEVTKKPEMIFTISVQTARSGKQSWKETAVFDGVTYPNRGVYVGSGLAKFSSQHEEKRFQAWKKALTSFWSAHYEDPATDLTAPTCDELETEIAALRQQAATEWETSEEGYELIRTLFEIGQEGTLVSRSVRKSGFGSVRVVYDIN